MFPQCLFSLLVCHLGGLLGAGKAAKKNTTIKKSSRELMRLFQRHDSRERHLNCLFSCPFPSGTAKDPRLSCFCRCSGEMFRPAFLLYSDLPPNQSCPLPPPPASMHCARTYPTWQSPPTLVCLLQISACLILSLRVVGGTAVAQLEICLLGSRQFTRVHCSWRFKTLKPQKAGNLFWFLCSSSSDDDDDEKKNKS